MRSIGVPENLSIFGERRNGGKPNSHASFILQAHFDEGAVVIYYGVPRKSVAQVRQKIYLDFCPLGQGDIKCQLVYTSLIDVLISPSTTKNYEMGRIYVRSVN